MIIGITGTLGAGKGTLVAFLQEHYGFAHYSVRRFLTQQLTDKGWPVNRDTMTTLANDLRQMHHPAYIVEQLYKQAESRGGNAIIESIRTPGEIDFLREQGPFCLVAVDADITIRYQRITERASSTDNVDFDTFKQNENREMETDNPNKQNLKFCIEHADKTFINNGSVDSFHETVKRWLQNKDWID